MPAVLEAKPWKCRKGLCLENELVEDTLLLQIDLIPEKYTTPSLLKFMAHFPHRSMLYCELHHVGIHWTPWSFACMQSLKAIGSGRQTQQVVEVSKPWQPK